MDWSDGPFQLMLAVLKRGYSLDDEEFNPGVRCLAAPVFDADHTVAAAVGITASTVRFTEKRIPEMAAAVKAAAAELSSLLGHVERKS
jgi:IclR family acetate operon transcriptional repressor